MSASRNRNRSRENAYPAVSPIPTDSNDVAEAMMKLLRASSRNEIGLLVGWAMT